MGDGLIVNKSLSMSAKITSIKALSHISHIDNKSYTYDVSSINNNDIKYIVFLVGLNPSVHGHNYVIVLTPDGKQIYSQCSHYCDFTILLDENTLTIKIQPLNAYDDLDINIIRVNILY